jgi:DeoR family suf operon transcriptional repressor
VTDPPGAGSLVGTRGAILRLLKRHGELHAEELAASLDITPSGMRQHLRVLVADDLVAYREQRGAAGRPRHLYRLTPRAEGMFPRRYGDLVTDLLSVASEDDPAFLDRMFTRRSERRLDAARVRLSGSLEQRVRALATVLDDDGYLAEVEPLPDGAGWRIVERNCAIFDIALRYGHACSSELDFLRAALPDADVVRVRHMVEGSTYCAYDVTPHNRGVGAGAAAGPAALDRSPTNR